MYGPYASERLDEKVLQIIMDSVRPTRCSRCMGSGSVEDPETGFITDCPECKGVGTFPNPNAPRCDFCGEPAVVAVPVYHPADAVQEPPVTGAFVVENLCGNCYSKGFHEEETFVCDGCSKRFISHRLWDGLVIESEDGNRYCQKCALEHLIKPKPVAEVVRRLRSDKRQTGDGVWYRIDNVPGQRLIWQSDYAPYNDYPGYQSLDRVADAIENTCSELGITEIIPLVTRQYQLSVKLGVFASYGDEEDKEGGE